MDPLEIKVLASGSHGNCYYVSDGSTVILLEAGIPYKEIQKGINFKTAAIKGIVVSHEHKDHSKAVKTCMKRGIDVYMSHGTADELMLCGHRIHRVTALKRFDIGTFSVVPFNTQHDAKQPFGYLIKSNVTEETLLFFTDTFYLQYLFKDIDYIIGECNYSNVILKANLAAGYINKALYDRIYRSHMSLETLVDFIVSLDKKRLKRIYLAHISDGNSDITLFKKEIQRLTGVEVILT